MDWNGLELQTELADLYNDDRPATLLKISKFIRKAEIEIAKAHTWPNLRVKGQKILTAGAEEVTLYIDPPSAPAVALAADGSLEAGIVYSVLVTFYETDGLIPVESKKGTVSTSLTTTSINKKIQLTGIPVSTDPLVTKRRIYLKKGSGKYKLERTIDDNITTTVTISDDTTSEIQPPENHNVQKLDGKPFIENEWQLKSMSPQQLRLEFEDSYEENQGTPEYYAALSYDKLLVYPTSSGSKTLSFYYFKRPRGIYPDAESIPEIQPELSEVLEAFVEWKSFQFKDRSGRIAARNYYDYALTEAISKYGKADKNSNTIRDVTGSNFE